ncbi:MAG: chromate transporter [Burkholderiaceae bacterium]
MDNQDTPVITAPTSKTDLFITFTQLALQGFGGVLAVAQRVLCDNKRWLTRVQFVEILSVAQILPGPNICNLSLMIGDRFFGIRGAFAALAGMMAIPLLIVLALTAVYMQFAANPIVVGALKGMGAVSAGLIIGTSFKLAGALRKNVLGIPACVLLAALTFGAVALLRWPLAWVLLGLGIPTCVWAWVVIKRGAKV